MGVTIDNTSNSGSRGSTQESLSHVCGPGTTVLVVVGMSRRSSGGVTITSITFDGDALIKLNEATGDGGASYASVWYRVLPTITTANIIVAYSGNPGIGVFGGISFLEAGIPVDFQGLSFGGVTTWTKAPVYNSDGYYVGGCPSSQHHTGWFGSQSELSGSICYCSGWNTNYARQAQGYYKIGSDMDAFLWQSPRGRWGSVALATVPWEPAVGGEQVNWVFSKIQSFYRDLKLGLIPPDVLRERYKELLPI